MHKKIHVTTSSVQRLQRSVIEFSLFVLLFSSLNAELIIPATGNVFYAMTSSSVDFLLRRKGGNTPLGSQPINTETSATFPRIKAKGRRLVRTLFWQQIFFPHLRTTATDSPHRPDANAGPSSHKQWMWPSLCENKTRHAPFCFVAPATLALPKNTKTKSSSYFYQRLQSGFCQTFQTSSRPAAFTRAVCCSFPKQYAFLIHT